MELSTLCKATLWSDLDFLELTVRKSIAGRKWISSPIFPKGTLKSNTSSPQAISQLLYQQRNKVNTGCMSRFWPKGEIIYCAISGRCQGNRERRGVPGWEIALKDSIWTFIASSCTCTTIITWKSDFFPTIFTSSSLW